jgi:hypothetical protein
VFHDASGQSKLNSSFAFGFFMSFSNLAWGVSGVETPLTGPLEIIDRDGRGIRRGALDERQGRLEGRSAAHADEADVRHRLARRVTGHEETRYRKL